MATVATIQYSFFFKLSFSALPKAKNCSGIVSYLFLFDLSGRNKCHILIIVKPLDFIIVCICIVSFYIAVDSCYFQKFTQDVTNRFHTLTLQRGVTSTARHSVNITCRGVTSPARHAARSHSFVYILTS